MNRLCRRGNQRGPQRRLNLHLLQKSQRCLSLRHRLQPGCFHSHCLPRRYRRQYRCRAARPGCRLSGRRHRHHRRHLHPGRGRNYILWQKWHIMVEKVKLPYISVANVNRFVFLSSLDFDLITDTQASWGQTFFEISFCFLRRCKQRKLIDPNCRRIFDEMKATGIIFLTFDSLYGWILSHFF